MPRCRHSLPVVPLRLVVRPSSFVRVAVVALVAQVVIVLTGSGVRLTGSGLGCTDWPRCFEDRTVPPWGFHHWVEFGNRLLSIVVVATAIAAVVAARRRRPYRRDLVWLSVGLVVGVVAQAVLGGILVLFDLDPRLNMGHFLLSMVLILDGVVLVHRAAERAPFGRVDEFVRRLAMLVVVAAGVVVATGSVVTGSGPHAGDDRAARLPFELVTVARVHAVSMWVFAAATVVCAVLAARRGVAAGLRRPMHVLLALVVAQGALGYTQYALGVPAGLVSLHILGACLVWWTSLVLWLRVRDAAAVTAPVAASVPEEVRV